MNGSESRPSAPSVEIVQVLEESLGVSLALFFFELGAPWLACTQKRIHTFDFRRGRGAHGARLSRDGLGTKRTLLQLARYSARLRRFSSASFFFAPVCFDASAHRIAADAVIHRVLTRIASLSGLIRPIEVSVRTCAVLGTHVRARPARVVAPSPVARRAPNRRSCYREARARTTCHSISGSYVNCA